jgi:hypothetical protein
MAGFILVQHEGVETDADLAAWLDLALAYVAPLPAKRERSARTSRSDVREKSIGR